MANNSVNSPNTITSSDPLGTLIMETRYTNYLLLCMLDGRRPEFDSVAAFMGEMTEQDIVGMPYLPLNPYSAKQPYQIPSTRN